jgi:Barstar (barnase inhibitor)
MQSFIFISDINSLVGAGVRVIEVPPTLASKKTLLAWYAKALAMPEGVGRNWDAFDECLRDLSWVEERKIVLYHRDIPLEESLADQQMYLDVLDRASRDWRPGEAHELIAAFDPACEPKLRTIGLIPKE